MFEKLILLLSGIDCNKKNPIEYDKMLRLPGQSLDEELDAYKDHAFEWLIYASMAMAFLMAIVFVSDPGFYYAGLIILLYLLFLVVFSAKYIKKIRNIKLGRDGERSVAQYLYIVARQLSKSDTNMHIFHDLVNQNKKFNIDHVVISKKGIFIIETKTYRKEPDRVNKISSKNNKLFRNDQEISTNIPLQVQGQAQWLQSELLQATGKRYGIVKIIAFVGWYVESEKVEDIYITQAKTIKNILENQYRSILYGDEELKRITSTIQKLTTVSTTKQKDICA